MTRLQEKSKLIKDLSNQQKKIVTKVNRLSKLGSGKRISTAINRAFKVINYAMELRGLEVQKQIIASQPIPKFNKGAVIVGENTKPEIIIDAKGKRIEIE